MSTIQLGEYITLCSINLDKTVPTIEEIICNSTEINTKNDIEKFLHSHKEPYNLVIFIKFTIKKDAAFNGKLFSINKDGRFYMFAFNINNVQIINNKLEIKTINFDNVKSALINQYSNYDTSGTDYINTIESNNKHLGTADEIVTFINSNNSIFGFDKIKEIAEIKPSMPLGTLPGASTASTASTFTYTILNKYSGLINKFKSDYAGLDADTIEPIDVDSIENYSTELTLTLHILLKVTGDVFVDVEKYATKALIWSKFLLNNIQEFAIFIKEILDTSPSLINVVNDFLKPKIKCPLILQLLYILCPTYDSDSNTLIYNTSQFKDTVILSEKFKLNNVGDSVKVIDELDDIINTDLDNNVSNNVIDFLKQTKKRDGTTPFSSVKGYIKPDVVIKKLSSASPALPVTSTSTTPSRSRSSSISSNSGMIPLFISNPSTDITITKALTENNIAIGYLTFLRGTSFNRFITKDIFTDKLTYLYINNTLYYYKIESKLMKDDSGNDLGYMNNVIDKTAVRTAEDYIGFLNYYTEIMRKIDDLIDIHKKDITAFSTHILFKHLPFNNAGKYNIEYYTNSTSSNANALENYAIIGFTMNILQSITSIVGEYTDSRTDGPTEFDGITFIYDQDAMVYRILKYIYVTLGMPPDTITPGDATKYSDSDGIPIDDSKIVYEAYITYAKKLTEGIKKYISVNFDNDQLKINVDLTSPVDVTDAIIKSKIYKSLQHDKDSYQSSYINSDYKVHQQIRQIDDLNDQISNLRKTGSVSTSTAALSSSDKAALDAQIADLEKEVADLKAEVATKNAELLDALDEQASVTNFMNAFEDEVKILKAEYNDLILLFKHFGLDTYKEKINEFIAMRTDIDDASGKLQNYITGVNTFIDEYKKESDYLTKMRSPLNLGNAVKHEATYVHSIIDYSGLSLKNPSLRTNLNQSDLDRPATPGAAAAPAAPATPAAPTSA